MKRLLDDLLEEKVSTCIHGMSLVRYNPADTRLRLNFESIRWEYNIIHQIWRCVVYLSPNYMYVIILTLLFRKFVDNLSCNQNAKKDFYELKAD